MVVVELREHRDEYLAALRNRAPREIDVQMLLGHADLTMTQRYARAYTSEQAVRAHAELSPVARLAAPAQPLEGLAPERDVRLGNPAAAGRVDQLHEQEGRGGV